MKISVIVPSLPLPKDPRSPQARRLREALSSLDAAGQSFGREVEVIVSWDREGRGPSWARNRGLEKARGDYVFFCDADDAVEPDFFNRPLAALDKSGADLCFFTYAGGPSLEAYELQTNGDVRAAYLPAFFGYSNDDVRRWNAGGSLGLLKELGQVWRGAYRRAFLERHAIRFDETMTFYEDAAFLANCVAFAEHTVSIPDALYDYRPRPTGNLASGSGSRRHWDYKFRILDFRKRLDAATHGEIWRYCEASCVFSALEMMRLWKRAGLSPAEFDESFSSYLSDPRVRDALRSFPVSLRHPLVLAGVAYLRWRTR